MDAVRSRARIHASRAIFEFASGGSVIGIANRTTTRKGVRVTLFALSLPTIRTHEARNNRDSRWFRLRPDDQGRGRADLPDGRVLVRQRRARCRTVQSGSAGVSIYPHRQSDHRYSRTARQRTRRRRRSLERRLRTNRAVLRGAQRHGHGPQHRLGTATLRHDLHSVRAHPAGDGRAGAIRAIRPRRRYRGVDRRRHPCGVLRNRRQSRRQCLRSRSACRRCASASYAVDRRQHGRDPDFGAPDRVTAPTSSSTH